MFFGISLFVFCFCSNSRRHHGLPFIQDRSRTILNTQVDDHGDCCTDPFISNLKQNCKSLQQQEQLIEKLVEEGLLSDNRDSSSLQAIFRRLDNEHISSVLIKDFGLQPWMAHQTRAAIVPVLNGENNYSGQTFVKAEPAVTEAVDTVDASKEDTVDETKRIKRPLYKATIVNTKAKARPRDIYGLSVNDPRYPKLMEELDAFFEFMTQPSILQQEAPIRAATADVYLRHARLFLGWHIEQQGDFKKNGSLFEILKSKEKETASDVFAFVLWLRKNREISASYEANVLRGLIKLFKYRFAHESDPTSTNQPYDDIPAIRELRKLHREANRKQTIAGRSSDEAKKWISWPQYLQVVNKEGEELSELLKALNPESKDAEIEQRKIAISYQKYLILQIFAGVPDRQRTIRELELGRTFVKDDDCWAIRHGADDYKTGKVYGQRAPIRLHKRLTEPIDDFVDNWRQYLHPSTNFIFVQPRTGKPLTQDSVYQIVTRSCYLHTGKRTNPHLLRDMIVTHVREATDASEKELEALALYMGHSIQMQRTSYDRRTLEKKVAPAVVLLESVNSESGRLI